jgi:hypothetical protein
MRGKKMKLRFVKIVNGYIITIPKPVLAVGFALEQTLRDATLAVFSFLILKRLQQKYNKFILRYKK